MAPHRVPLLILAGSDRRPGPVPAGADSFHFVAGYKGAEFLVEGRCLAAVLVERCRQSGAFEDVSIVGPTAVYRDLVDCPIVDTDGHVGINVRAGIRDVLERHGADSPVAVMACDVLPSVEEIASLASALAAPLAEGAAFCFPLIRAAEDLGASSWKPQYGVRPEVDAEPVAFLPGHLVVARPSQLRMGVLYRLLDLFYRERNRDYDERRRVIVLLVLWTLIKRDLSNLMRFAAPVLTWTVLRHGLRIFWLWRRGQLDFDSLARHASKLLVRRAVFRRLGPRAVRFVVSDALAFAKDVDTREELEEIGGTVSNPATE